MSNPTVKSIVTEYLKNAGYDGLYAEGECGCLVDDLMPCNDAYENCRAGYKLPGDDDAGWYVGPKKPKE